MSSIQGKMGWKDKFDIEQIGKCHYKQIWRYFKNKIQANVMNTTKTYKPIEKLFTI